MGGEYNLQCRSAVKFAERMLQKEMKRIREMEAQGLNPYEVEKESTYKRYSKKERFKLTKDIIGLIEKGVSQKDACLEYEVPVGTFRKWRQRLKL